MVEFLLDEKRVVVYLISDANATGYLTRKKMR